MFVEIITPDRKVFSAEASVVTLPGVNGSFQQIKLRKIVEKYFYFVFFFSKC